MKQKNLILVTIGMFLISGLTMSCGPEDADLTTTKDTQTQEELAISDLAEEGMDNSSDEDLAVSDLEAHEDPSFASSETETEQRTLAPTTQKDEETMDNDSQASTDSESAQCEDSDPKCVKSYNRFAKSQSLGTHNIRVVRVTMPNHSTTSMSSIKSNVKELINSYRVASRGRFNLILTDTITKEVEKGNCSQAKNKAMLGSPADILVTIYVLPKGVCDYSNAGGKNAYVNDDLIRTYAHEVGHLLGLAHGNRIEGKTGKFEEYGDASTFMGSMPAKNYSIPQLHWLGWTNANEIVRINSEIETGRSIEVRLRPIDANAQSDNDLPLSYVYEVNNDTRLFIAIPKSTSGGNKIDGGEIFVYRAKKCVGCKGMAMGSLQVGRIFTPKNSKDYNIEGLIINPISYKSEKIKGDEKFREITLRISKSQ